MNEGGQADIVQTSNHRFNVKHSRVGAERRFATSLRQKCDLLYGKCRNDNISTKSRAESWIPNTLPLINLLLTPLVWVPHQDFLRFTPHPKKLLDCRRNSWNAFVMLRGELNRCPSLSHSRLLFPGTIVTQHSDRQSNHKGL